MRKAIERLKMKRISKDTAISMIEKSSGRFLTIKNIKKNGESRTYKSSKYNMDMYGNINVLTKDGFRNIIPSTIYYLKANKQEYAVV
jgi:hypothetical protein|tara:strand:- start:488 stop:748 length:261 start_codon:yes stop_codon:yes gene_type:complete